MKTEQFEDKNHDFFQDHCDFTTVQNLLWGQNTQDLIESTHQVNSSKISLQKDFWPKKVLPKNDRGNYF